MNKRAFLAALLAFFWGTSCAAGSTYFDETLNRISNGNLATENDINDVIDQVDDSFQEVEDDIDLKAPLASPAFTGTPTAPTATAGTATTQIATTAFVSATSFSSVLPGQTGNSGKYLTTDGSNASWVSAPYVGRNLAINSDFLLNQESYDADGVDSLAAGEYGHDMWRAVNGSLIYTKNGAADITINSLTAASATFVALFQQNDELIAASGEEVTISFEVVSLDSGMDLYFDGSSVDTIASTGKKSYTVTADGTGSIHWRHTFGSAGTYSPNFRFKNFKIEYGDVETDYEIPEPRQEEKRCLYYYQRVSGAGMAFWNSNTQKYMWVNTHAKMKDSPDVTFVGSVVLNTLGSQFTEALTYVSTGYQGDNGFFISANHSTSSTGSVAWFASGPASYIEFDNRY